MGAMGAMGAMETAPLSSSPATFDWRDERDCHRTYAKPDKLRLVILIKFLILIDFT